MATVLFVCYNNAGRSLMAESIFNSKALERHMDARADSGGLLALGAVHPQILRCVAEMGVSVQGLRPKQITKEMVESVKTIVGFGGINSSRTPVKFDVTEHWSMSNPSGVDYGALCVVRDAIARNVDDLLERIASSS